MNLDMGNGQDRQIMQAACKRRWPIPRDVRQECLRQLAELLKRKDLTVREKNSTIRTLAQLDRLNVDYTAMEDKIHRLDTGQPTDITLEFTFDSPSDCDVTDPLSETEGGRL